MSRDDSECNPTPAWPDNAPRTWPAAPVMICKRNGHNAHINDPGLATIELENTEEHRMTYRKLLFEAPKAVGEALGGCILFHETLYQKDNDGKLIVDNLKERGIILGIKVGFESV